MKTFRLCLTPLLLLAAQAALAHHPMGGATPGTMMEGLLSGFGHPIIGMDHLLFIMALGVTCFYFGRHVVTIAVFLAGTLAGTLLHLQWPAAPMAEACVAVSLLALGVLFVVHSAFLASKAAALLFAASGVAHGYAYGEAIVGAEATPLLAYLIGFTLIQFAIAASGYLLARFVAARKPALAPLKVAGGVLTLAGTGFLAFALVAQG